MDYYCTVREVGINGRGLEEPITNSPIDKKNALKDDIRYTVTSALYVPPLFSMCTRSSICRRFPLVTNQSRNPRFNSSSNLNC